MEKRSLWIAVCKVKHLGMFCIRISFKRGKMHWLLYISKVGLVFLPPQTTRSVGTGYNHPSWDQMLPREKWSKCNKSDDLSFSWTFQLPRVFSCLQVWFVYSCGLVVIGLLGPCFLFCLLRSAQSLMNTGLIAWLLLLRGLKEEEEEVVGQPIKVKYFFPFFKWNETSLYCYWWMQVWLVDCCWESSCCWQGLQAFRSIRWTSYVRGLHTTLFHVVKITFSNCFQFAIGA